MRYSQACLTAAMLSLTIPAWAIEQGKSQEDAKTSEQSGQGLTQGLGLTNRPASGGGMGEDKTPGGSAEGPRALPPGGAPGYEGADEGKTVTPRVGSQSDFSPPAGPPEDPVPRSGSSR